MLNRVRRIRKEKGQGIEIRGYSGNDLFKEEEASVSRIYGNGNAIIN